MKSLGEHICHDFLHEKVYIMLDDGVGYAKHQKLQKKIS